MTRLVLLSLATLLLVRCQTFSSHPNSELNSQKTLSFSFASSRRFEIKPCGCTTRPLGGMNREWNALKDYKTYSFSAGTSFFSTAEKKSALPEKAKIFFNALEKLNTLAISVSLEDMSMGVDTLLGFKKLTKIPFIASNLKDNNPQPKQIFDTHLDINIEGTQILVLSFSDSLENYPEINQFKVTPPEDALKKHMATKADLVIVLSNLPQSKIKKLSPLIKKPHLFLGGAEAEHSPYVFQIANRGIALNPIPSGRAIGLITVQTGQFANEVFYNDDFFYEIAVKRNYWKAYNTPQSKENLKLTDKMNFDFKFTKIPYVAQIFELESDLDSPQNPIDNVFKDYNKTLQERAVNELDQ